MDPTMQAAASGFEFLSSARSGPISMRKLWRWLVAALAVMGFVVALLGALSLRMDRHDAWLQARQAQSNVAATLSQDIARNFELYDLSLKNLLTELDLPEIVGFNTETRRRVVFDGIVSANFIGGMFVTDRDGAITLASRTLVNAVNVADRDYFIAAQKSEADKLIISAPLQTRQPGSALSLVLGRRRLGPDGLFDGVVGLSLRLSYFQDRLAPLSLPAGARIGLYRDDGILILRHPYNPAEVGKDTSAFPLWPQFASTTAGFMIGKTPGSDDQRLILHQHVGALPLVLVVSVPVTDIMHAWGRKAWATGMLAGSLTICILCLVMLTRQEFYRAHRVNHALQALSMTDALTGLANRRRLDARLAQEWQRAQRNGEPLSFILLDVDQFKVYNDLYGHPAGDSCLQKVARILQGQVHRPGDVVARYGGEEMAVLLPGTDAIGAAILADRICVAIHTAAIPHRGSEFTVVTASLGIATLMPQRGVGSPTSLIACADEALYRAKRGGRNRIEAAVPMMKISLDTPGTIAPYQNPELAEAGQYSSMITPAAPLPPAPGEAP